MSCIQKILEKKGSAEILAPEEGYGYLVEGGGNYKGFDWLITFTDMGHRCGYVAVSKEQSEAWDMEKEIECHGGVTFFEHPTQKLKAFNIDSDCDDIWLGFDCAHGWDTIDLASFNKYKEYWSDEVFAFVSTRIPLGAAGDVRSAKYVKNECYKIIDQIVERADERN